MIPLSALMLGEKTIKTYNMSYKSVYLHLFSAIKKTHQN